MGVGRTVQPGRARAVSGQDDDLGRVDEPGAEADLIADTGNTSAAPLGTCPSRSSRSAASGIDAADVLPVSAMSRPTTTVSGSFRVLIIWSMIRMFAWWGMNASISSAVTPAASIAFCAIGAICQTAHL